MILDVARGEKRKSRENDAENKGGPRKGRFRFMGGRMIPTIPPLNPRFRRLKTPARCQTNGAGLKSRITNTSGPLSMHESRESVRRIREYLHPSRERQVACNHDAISCIAMGQYRDTQTSDCSSCRLSAFFM